MHNEFPDAGMGWGFSKQYDIMLRILVTTAYIEIAENIEDYSGTLLDWVRKHRNKIGAFNLLDEAVLRFNARCPAQTIEEFMVELQQHTANEN